jgi:glycosyltransferase involved in cell wall biosynthesis
MLLLDLTHTAHTRSRTGIQRVARALASELGAEALPICHDRYLGAWRPLEPWEAENLAAREPAKRRRGSWPIRARVRGYLRRLAGGRQRPAVRSLRLGSPARGLLVPEIFSPEVARALPPLFASVSGPRVAIFYDAIPFTHPECTPAATVGRFPAYMQDLLAFDGVAAISRDSRDSLLGYWDWLGVAKHPTVAAIPLGLAEPGPAFGGAGPGSISSRVPTLLSVGTIEGRKNHRALLEACERLWVRGLSFELRLIGLAQKETGREALTLIDSLKRKGRALRYDGPVNEAELEAAYASCAFTVYPSVAEGFGLPVIESVARGKPCVCLGQGALGEAAQGGGCLMLRAVDSKTLENAIAGLLNDSVSLARFEAEARSRTVKSWVDYVRELAGWMGSLAAST